MITKEAYEVLKSLRYSGPDRSKDWQCFTLRLPIEMVKVLDDMQRQSGLSRNELLFQVLRTSMLMQQSLENPEESIMQNMKESLSLMVEDLITQTLKKEKTKFLKSKKQKA